jgi:hypothetical protein
MMDRSSSSPESQPDARLPVAGAHRPGIITLILPSILLVIACLVPFLNKAYTIDDPWFLLEARQILKTPLQPMSFPVCWLGHETCVARAGSLGAGSTQSLMGYLLVPVILAGGAEWIAHLLQILLACIAALEMVRLAMRLGFDRLQASAAGLMLVAIPPFLPMASTAMPDIAALTLGLTGIERLLAWKDERRWHQAAAASLALGLAPYARPHMVLLIPLGALWLFNEFRIRKAVRQFRREAYLWAPLLVAACILVAVNLVTRDHGPKVESKSLLIGLSYLPINLQAYLLYLTFPIPFAAVWLGTHWRKAPMILMLPAVLVLVIHVMLFRSRSIVEEWPLIAAFFGLTTLAYMLYQNVRAWDRLGLLLSLWLLIPVPAIFYAQLPIKYLLGVLPAVVLILIRVLSSLPRRRELSAYGVLAFFCAAYSCVVLRADADFAEYGRRAAAELIAAHVAAGEKVWYGGQWGFYWYAQEAGARISKPGEPGPNPGELLAVGLLEGGNVTRNRFPNRELLDSRHYDAPHGRTMGYSAGLYSNYFGPALWVWSPETTNDYELWRIH